MPNLIMLIFFTVSVILNVFLVWKLRKPKPELSLEAKDLLHYLTRGGAVVKIEIIDPSSLMVYRGK